MLPLLLLYAEYNAYYFACFCSMYTNSKDQMCNVYIMAILSSLFGESHLTYNSFEFSEFVALRLKMSLR